MNSSLRFDRKTLTHFATVGLHATGWLRVEKLEIHARESDDLVSGPHLEAEVELKYTGKVGFVTDTAAGLAINGRHVVAFVPEKVGPDDVVIRLRCKTALLGTIAMIMKVVGKTFDWGWGRTENGVERLAFSPAKIPCGEHGCFGDFAELKALSVHPHDPHHPLHLDFTLKVR